MEVGTLKNLEKEQLEKWHQNNEFEQIVRYIDLLRQPTYEHLGKKASALNNLRRFYDAIDVLNSIKQEGETDSLWHYRYGYALMNVDRFVESEQSLLKSVALDEKNGDAWYLLSVIYHNYLPNEEKEAWVREKLEHAECDAQELHYDNFVKGQAFNSQYHLLEYVEFENDFQKAVVTNSYQKLIDALEHVVTDNDQLPLLVIGLAETVKSTSLTLLDEDLGSQLVAELAYILNWFGIEQPLIMTLLNLFSYALEYDSQSSPPGEVTPRHLSQLMMWLEKKQYQAILDLFFSLPMEKQTYDYGEWAIQALIYLKEYDRAQYYLDLYSEEGEDQPYWHYWYGSVQANQGRFEEAKKHLMCSVDLDPYNKHAWLMLEDVCLRGLNDVFGANWARKERERLDEE